MKPALLTITRHKNFPDFRGTQSVELLAINLAYL